LAVSVPRFALLAHPGPLAEGTLAQLLRRRCAPCAIVMHAPPAPPSLPVRVTHAGPPSLLELAAEHGIPVLALARLDDRDALAALAALAAQVFLVACFPSRIPTAVRALAPLGCFNLHPSLLPRYRGPEPLFWQFRAAEERLGCSLHVVTGRIDCGPVLARAAVELPADADHAAASRLLGGRGAGLFAGLLPAIGRGAATARPQDESCASYFPFPAATDFGLPTAWSARRAFQFMHATAAFARPYPVVVAGETVWLARALDWDDATMSRALVRDGPEVHVRFARGVLHAQLADDRES